MLVISALLPSCALLVCTFMEYIINLCEILFIYFMKVLVCVLHAKVHSVLLMYDLVLQFQILGI